VPALSVAENIMLGHLPTRRLSLDARAMHARAAAALDRLGVSLPLDARVDRLTHAERQMVAIARALSQRARLLILDEPTAALAAREVQALFDVLAALRADGVAILYVSHRLARGGGARRSLRGAARRPTGLRRCARHVRYRCTDPAHDRARARSDARHRGRDVGRARAGDRRRFRGSRAARSSGSAGLLGSGTQRFLRRLFGAADPPQRFSTPRQRQFATPPRQRQFATPPRQRQFATPPRQRQFSSPRDAVAAGLGLVVGDRAQALVLGRSVRDNIALPSLTRLARMWRIDERAVDRIVAELIEALDIRPRDPHRPVARAVGRQSTEGRVRQVARRRRRRAAARRADPGRPTLPQGPAPSPDPRVRRARRGRRAGEQRARGADRAQRPRAGDARRRDRRQPGRAAPGSASRFCAGRFGG